MRILWLTISLCLGLIAPEAKAGPYPRDFSGDAMQRHESRLPSSPMVRFPSLLGMTYWPFIPYTAAPSFPVFNFVIQLPEEVPALPPAKPPAPAKFWIARCGTFVEIDVAKSNVLEEEGKSCSP